MRIIRLGLILMLGWGLLAHSAYGQTNAPASVQAPAESLSESGKKAATAGEKATTGTPSPAKTAAAFDWWDLLKIVGGASLGFLIKAIFDLFALRKASERKIVETMTTKLHEYAEKYYMGCINQAERAKRNIEIYTTLPATPPAPQQPPHDTESSLRALHAIALLHSKINKGKREIGGVFLTTRTGEAIVSGLEGEITSQITKSVLTIEDVLQIIALVEPEAGKDAKDVRDVTFLAFRKAAADDAVKELCDKWRAWLAAKGQEVADLVLILSCYSRVLLCEVNRPYEAWYRQRESPFMGSQELKLMVKMAKEHTPVSSARVRYLKLVLKGCTERSLRKELIQQGRT